MATAHAEAEAFLSDDTKLETLRVEISDAVEWFPLRLSDDWNFDVEIDESVLAAFDPTDVELVRADPAATGLFMTLTVAGTARFDLAIHKANAVSSVMAARRMSGSSWNFGGDPHGLMVRR